MNESFPAGSPVPAAPVRAHARRRNRSAVRHDPEVASPDEVVIGVVEVVVGPIIHGDALGGQAVPRLDVVRKECPHTRALVMTEVVPPHLPMIVRQPIGIGARLRQEQQAHVFVGIGGDQDDFRRLEILVASHHIVDAGHSSVRAHLQRRHVRACDHFKVSRVDGPRNGRDVGGVLRVDRTATLVAEPVVAASRPILIRFTVDCGWPGKRAPSQRTRRVGHPVMKGSPPQGRHGKVTLSRSLESISA